MVPKGGPQRPALAAAPHLVSGLGIRNHVAADSGYRGTAVLQGVGKEAAEDGNAHVAISSEKGSKL